MKRIRLIIILAGICAILAVPFLVFYNRPPVLVVTEAPYAVLYGASNLKRQQLAASWELRRRVLPVMVADAASPDVVIFAIAEASSRPLCVLFARSQIASVRAFHEQFPEIPAVLFSGVLSASGLPTADGVLCVYATDRETDLYRAGLCAGILGTARQKNAKKAEGQEESAPKQNRYALWQDRYVQAAGREIFSRGVKEQDPESVIVFASSAAEMPDMGGLSCAVLTGAGAEYFEKNPKIPIIMFGWTDPALTAREVAVQFDDSVWGLAAPATRMALNRQAEGKIPSNPLIFSEKTSDNAVLRILKKSAKKVP
jgi:hypothetical protein